ncbi:MAG TPA: cytochrome c biogenesis protein CcdA [Elusimicrobiota bacterium]|nr:cytochrome c biogenesis protein CcdA [Elusimicrobiota bacterium]
METSLGFAPAFLSGLLTLLSPSLFPILLVWLSYILGLTYDSTDLPTPPPCPRSLAAAHCGVMAACFFCVFILMGASSSPLGQYLFNQQTLFQRGGGVFVLLLGLWMTDVTRLSSVTSYRIDHYRNSLKGLLGSALIGSALAFAWTPCDGPVLGSILLLAGTPGTVFLGMKWLLVYSIGLALPLFSLTVILFGAGRSLRRFAGISFWLNRAAGTFLILNGLLMLTGHLSRLSGWMTQAFEPWMDRLMNLGL